MELLKIWTILIRRRWVILMAFLVFVFAVLAFTLVVTPSYKATTKVLVKSSSATNSLLTALKMQLLPFAIPSEYDTDISLALSKSLVKKVIDKFQIKDRFGREMREEKFIKSSFLNLFWPQPAVEVEQYKESTILEISAISVDSMESAKIANLMAECFVQKRKEIVRDEYKQTKIFVEQQVISLRQRYYSSLEKMSDFMTAEKSIDFELEAQNLINKINETIIFREANDNSLVLYEKEIKENKRYLENMGEYRKEYEEFIENPRLNDLKGKLHVALISLAGKEIDFLPSHPEYRQVVNEIDKQKELIRKELTQELVFSKERSSINPLHDAIYKKYIDNKVNLELAFIKKDLLNQTIGKYQEELLTFPLKKIKQSKLALELEVSSNMYNNLLSYLAESEIAQSIDFANYRIAEFAKQPQKVNFPNKKLNMILGIILGCLWAFFIGFFVEYTDDTLRSHEDIKRLGNINLLGRVYKGSGFTSKLLLNPSLPKSQVVETYRSMKNNIYIAGNGQPPETLIITSSVKGEGKSTIATNLAMAYAMEGRQTLLVDGNLRLPRIHKLLPVVKNKGFSGLLNGAEIKDCVSNTGFKQLDVLTSGPVPDDPGGLIEACKLEAVLADFHLSYDLVIFDSPPLAAAGDAILLHRKMAADSILVAEPGKVTYKVLADSLSMFEKSGGKLIGVVVNKVRSVEGGAGADSFEDIFEKCLRSPVRIFKKIFY